MRGLDLAGRFELLIADLRRSHGAFDLHLSRGPLHLDLVFGLSSLLLIPDTLHVFLALLDDGVHLPEYIDQRTHPGLERLKFLRMNPVLGQ